MTVLIVTLAGMAVWTTCVAMLPAGDESFLTEEERDAVDDVINDERAGRESYREALRMQELADELGERGVVASQDGAVTAVEPRAEDPRPSPVEVSNRDLD